MRLNIHEGNPRLHYYNNTLDYYTLNSAYQQPTEATTIEVILRHFHRYCYKSSPLWFFVGEGLSLSDASYGWTWWISRFTWFGLPERNTLRLRENGSCIAVCCSSVDLAPVILMFVWPFIAQDHGKYNVTQARQVAPGWLDPYVLGHYLPAVANDDFNGSLRTRALPAWCSEWWLQRYGGCRVLSSRHVTCMRGAPPGSQGAWHCSCPSWVGSRSALHCSGMLLVASGVVLLRSCSPQPICLVSI
jgi:hypothetical protein